MVAVNARAHHPWHQGCSRLPARKGISSPEIARAESTSRCVARRDEMPVPRSTCILRPPRIHCRRSSRPDLSMSEFRAGLEYACRSCTGISSRRATAPWTYFLLWAISWRKISFSAGSLEHPCAMDDAARALTATIKWLNEVCPERCLSGFPMCNLSDQAPIDTNPLLAAAVDLFASSPNFLRSSTSRTPHLSLPLLLAPESSVVRKLYGNEVSSPVARIWLGYLPHGIHVQQLLEQKLSHPLLLRSPVANWSQSPPRER